MFPKWLIQYSCDTPQIQSEIQHLIHISIVFPVVAYSDKNSGSVQIHQRFHSIWSKSLRHLSSLLNSIYEQFLMRNTLIYSIYGDSPVLHWQLNFDCVRALSVSDGLVNKECVSPHPVSSDYGSACSPKLL